MTGRELWLIAQAHARGHLSGDGEFTRRCHRWLEQATGSHRALLTHSCTAALEMAALLLDLQPGDEVILPSYTFVSTANAFVLRGAVPVFVDIRADTLNLDETLIEAAITPRTRAICPVHYAGVACEMDAINAIAERHIEERAEQQAVLLDRASNWVKPGGVLVYAVCSLEPEEGEAVIDQFLAADSRFAIDPVRADELPAGVAPDALGRVRTLPGMLAEAGGLDGFFMARLRRTA
ncbi:aminotransferase class I/II-fold pyridoxal phosphate-dependent enzyme [Blastomonas sp.]|uniref:aminotransferase class I/II-fold pyridoxal phosphate-dependent enzyme n=1 Tax=Blastomonas sp. TaxID=1909299 RepID=UPI0025839F5B|nr:aminotransferase class I/II-fold pyridoxal phosphate-dependent enzyme [Blastomonas sp.]